MSESCQRLIRLRFPDGAPNVELDQPLLCYLYILEDIEFTKIHELKFEKV
jgi:hypothetical protein